MHIVGTNKLLPMKIFNFRLYLLSLSREVIGSSKQYSQKQLEKVSHLKTAGFNMSTSLVKIATEDLKTK